uniref:Uncharacterized protein n=2 Tax=Magallana gigas TaxID=29159 RepID=A0A8W8MWP6_MAGGI
RGSPTTMFTIQMFTLLCVLGIVNCSLTWEKKNIGDENYYRTYLPRWIQMMNRLAARGLLSVSSVQQYEQFLSTIRPLIDKSDV